MEAEQTVPLAVYGEYLQSLLDRTVAENGPARLSLALR
jgi:hypothetical protein